MQQANVTYVLGASFDVENPETQRPPSMTYSAPVREPLPRPARKIIVQNALAHFRVRASSWSMAILSLLIGVIFTVNPDVITDNPGADVYLAYVARIAPTEVWRALFLLIGFTRLVSLIVNGSFSRVWWTPHVRMSMSFLSALIWLQFAISVWSTSHPAIATVVFPWFVLVETYNTAVASYETKRRPEGEFG